MFNPTEGPYEIYGWHGEHDESGAAIKAKDGRIIASTAGVLKPQDPKSWGEYHCNARLLAASWDLYQALKLYKDYRDNGMGGSSSKEARQTRADMHDAIEAALAKAEGRSE
jgi:hypothetical protein